MRLQGIFARVFLSFWAAIVLIAAAAVAITTVNFIGGGNDPPTITQRAAEILQSKGLPALREWLTQRNKTARGQRTLIIDESGKDILGQEFQRRPREGPPPGSRPPPPDQPREMRPPPMGAPFGEHGDFPRPPGSRIQAADGTSYYVLFDPPPRKGPFSPPFSWPARGILFGLAVAISGLISYLLARSIGSPLQKLESATRALSSGNLNARTGADFVRRKDELGSLGREFDAMAERLGALIYARQQLLRDISHELRSPLARLRMAIQLIRQGGSNPASQIDRIERESERLERLVDQILEYARLERDPSTVAIEEVDLNELVRQIVHDAAFESQSTPSRVRFEPTGELLVRVDPSLLHAAIDNVVRNALIHGGDASPVEVSMQAVANEIVIKVRDHGLGVPEAQLDKIFEPFYRVVEVSSSRPASEGSGIGLAVTARAIALHGGRVSAENAPGGGLVVTLILPIS